MGLLDLLKSQPKWKHPDALVRISAVRELAESEQDVFAAVAREDADGSVRRAAVERLTDFAELASLARMDPDTDVRDLAARRLVDLACEDEREDQVEALLVAVGSLPEAALVPALTRLGREAALESMARGALARLLERQVDRKLVAGLARQAVHAAVRADALGALTDEHDLAAVAIKTDFKDAGLAAVERLQDREQLEIVATRAKNRVVGRRARAILRDRDAREQARLREASAQAEARRRQALELYRAADQLRQRTATRAGGGDGLDWDGVAEEVARLEENWRVQEPPIDEGLIAKFEAALAAIRAALDAHSERRAEARRLADAREADLAARRALVERVEGLPSPASADETETLAAAVAELEREWRALGPCPGDEAAALAGRFERACRTWSVQAGRLQRARQARPQLEQVLAELEALAASEAPDPQHVARLSREWVRLAADPEHHADLIARAASAQGRLETRLAELREAKAREERANLVRLQQLAARAEALGAAESPALKALERVVRDVRAALDHPPPLPSRRDLDALRDRLRAVLAQLTPKVTELREADEWRRWANAGVQEELCRRAEALLQEEDLEAAWRQSRELFAEWRTVATAPRDRAQALWTRFRTAQDQIRAKCDAYFARQAEERAAALAAKLALCERAEALAESTDWIRTADELKRLQQEWETIGPVPRGQEKQVWDRFRSACDRFFTRRHDDLVRRKKEWASNLAQKEALCVKAEALAESTDWDAAAAEFKRLQQEWKTIGPVRRNKSEQIWQRFRAAADRFYERYHRRHQIQPAEGLSDRESVCAEIEALASGADLARNELVSRLRAVRTRWQQAPAPTGREAAVEERFWRAFERILVERADALKGTELDVVENQRRMERLCAEVEALAANGQTSSAASVAALAARLREALAANTIGGRVSEAARWRTALEEVRNAQAAWRRIGPVPRAIERPLAHRFRRACNQFFEEMRRRQGDAR